MLTAIYKQYRILIFSCLVVMGCRFSPTKEGVWKNKEIPQDEAVMLRKLNTDLFKAIQTDRDDAELLCSKDFVRQKNVKVQFDYVNKLRNEGDYVLLKDYYIVNQGTSDEDLRLINNAEINYMPLTKEMYMAFFVPKNKKNKIMLTVVYGKYNEGWKANQIALGYYTQRGKTANELYEIAKQEYSEGYLINAINTIVAATNATASAYLKNPKDEEIRDFAKKIIDEANSKISYPIVLNNVKSKPGIFSISSNDKEDGMTQYVYYLTKLNITDSAALKKENDEIKQQLPKIFPGIDKGEKTILYSAMKQKPIPGESIPHVDFEEKINN